MLIYGLLFRFHKVLYGFPKSHCTFIKETTRLVESDQERRGL
jgi:hypothetical protein